MWEREGWETKTPLAFWGACLFKHSPVSFDMLARLLVLANVVLSQSTAAPGVCVRACVRSCVRACVCLDHHGLFAPVI